MKAFMRRTGWQGVCLALAVIIPATALISVSSREAAAADDKQEAAQLLEKAKFTLQEFMADKNMAALQDLAKKARGIFVAPQVLKGAFVIGISGGSGAMVAWDEKSGQWAGPAFYTVGGLSYGFQIGGEASEVILLAMSERGVTAMLSNSLKLGGNVGLAAGPVGVGASASSANLSADILSFARSKGLYGGISLDGAVVAVRDGLNEAFYGKKVTPTDILIRREVKNPEAEGFLEAVRKVAGR